MNTTQKSYTILGATVNATVPLDAASYDEAAGQLGACVTTALGYQMPRTFHSKVRSGIIAALESRGHAQTEGETQEKFVNRVLDGGAISRDEYQTIATTVAAGVDSLACLAGAERASIGEEWLNKAREAQAAWNNGTAVFANSLARWQAADSTINVNDQNDTEQVARALRAFVKANEKNLI